MRLEVHFNEGRHSHPGMALSAKCGCRFEVELQDDEVNDAAIFVPCEYHKDQYGGG